MLQSAAIIWRHLNFFLTLVASGKKREKSRAAPARLWETSRYFWKVTPTTATLTQATLNPLVFSTALNTASCTARATSVTT